MGLRLVKLEIEFRRCFGFGFVVWVELNWVKFGLSEDFVRFRFAVEMVR